MLKDRMVGHEVLILAGKYANHIGVYTALEPNNSRNWVILVAGVHMEYPLSALRIWPNGRREVGIIRPEDFSSDKTEFNRIKAAKNGSVRLERGDDYVIIGHCCTITWVERLQIKDTYWYVSINYKGDPIKRAEFDDLQLSYDALEAFIVGVIVAHQKELKQ